MAARYTLEQAQELHLPILKAASKANGASSVAIDRPVCVVGARRLVHLPLSATCISKAQALIVLDTSGVYVRDLASRNQTFVNDQPVREARLETNDVLRFGPYIFQCESGFERSSEAGPLEPAELWLESAGSNSPQVVPLEQYTCLIGSRYGCDLLLNGQDIALAHAVIFVRDGRRFLRDLSSHTGTLINGQPCREVELNRGDEIRIGDSRIEYQLIEASVPLDGEAAIDEDAKEATHIAEPLEELAGGEVSEEPAPIAFEESQDVPASADGGNEIAMPWEELEPVEFELDPEESSGAVSRR